MICREYLENFPSFCLLDKLFLCDFTLCYLSVHSYLLIMSRSGSLSTFPNFGANLISLYLFSAKNCGNLHFFP